MSGKLLIMLGLFLYGCNEVAITGREKIVNRGDQPGLVKTRQFDKTEYRVEFLPDYSKRLKSNPETYFYFKFNIRNAVWEENKELLQYMNYQMQQDFVLRLNGDSIPCIFYQPIPKGFGDKLEFLVAYELGQPVKVQEADMEFVFNDHVIKNVPIVFPYTSKDFPINDNKKAE